MDKECYAGNMPERTSVRILVSGWRLLMSRYIVAIEAGFTSASESSLLSCPTRAVSRARLLVSSRDACLHHGR